LVCFHGGGFVSGNKEHDDMIEFCKTFAKKGYVTATAQYRLGMNLLSNTSGERSVYRAIQDSRALLRYLRENAATLKISPDHIYVLGSSAGAFMALHNLYMDKESERPAGTYQITGLSTDAGPDLGTLDAIGSYFSLNSKSNGIVSLWGAVQNTTLIEASDPQIPVLLVHGTADAIVPFGLGSPFQASTLTPTYGSQLIDQRLTALSYSHETYFVQGEGHEFYGVLNGNWNPAPNQYWNIVVNRVRDFLLNIHKPVAAFNQTVNNAQVTFTNTSTGATAWNWDFGDGTTGTEQNPVHTYLQSGTYNVKLSAFSEVNSVHTTTNSVVVILTAVNEESLPTITTLYQNYPNPFNPTTTITYKLSSVSNVTLKIYDVLGREVASLVNELQNAGEYKVSFDGGRYSGGVYFYKIHAVESDGKQFTSIKKLVLLK